MKRWWWMSVAVIGALPMSSWAECTPATRLTGRALQDLVSGNTLCASRNADRWQQQHHPDGTLWDYKMGPGHPVDPSKQVGTWRIQGNQITYTYTGGQSYTYSIHKVTGATARYDFCVNPNNGTPSISGATFQTGLTRCP